MLDIQALKSNLDLVSLIRRRGLRLEQKGKNWFTHCPFHQGDRTPSLSVDSANQLWSCFGCGVGGDVFTFFQLLDQASFFETVKKLCKKDIQEQDLDDLNVQRETVPTPKKVDRPSQEILDRIVSFWQKTFAASAEAQAYAKQRKIWAPEILTALKVGFSNGKLRTALPEDGKLRRQLIDLGILNEKGNEFFYNRLVVPLFDETGVLVSVYGRAVSDKSKAPHLYLKGPRRGVFNPAGIPEGGPVILAESIVDALTLLAMGFTNVTCSFGVNGFTADLRKLLVVRHVKQVLCIYDADRVAEHAVEQLAYDLANHAIEVKRVDLPTKDVNELAMDGGKKDRVDELIAKASPIFIYNTRSSVAARREQHPLLDPDPDEDKDTEALARPAPAPRAPHSPHPPAPVATLNPEPVGDPALTFTYGERTYQVDGDPERSRGVLKVTLKVTGYGKKPFVDAVNLYSDRARAALIGRLFTVFRGKAEKAQLEEDLFALLDELEKRAVLEDEPERAPAMTPQEEDDALSFLTSPRLLGLVLEDITTLGVVGEDDNKLLAYLVATSRKLKKPLSLSVISRSSAGKSWLLNRVADLMPPEEVLRYTRMSPRALFYDEPGRYKHKILFIEEAIGAKDADLGVRSIQSEKRLANLATMTDPKTGKLKTQENIVEGPLTYLTSSTEPLDDETATRGFEVAIDESSTQTRRIVTNLFQERTLEGIQERLDRDQVVKRHQNVQRLLEPVWVVNSYAPQLSFPDGSLRLRREADKYLSLIETIAFLHQKQRQVKTFRRRDETLRYIEVTPEDIDCANRLMVGCLARSLSDLPGPAQELLVKIRDYVVEKKGDGDLQDVTFNRREIREWVRWSDYQVRLYLDRLTEMEYVEPVSGSFGKRFLYALSADHQLVVGSGLTTEQKIAAIGLTPAATLRGPDLATNSATLR